MVANSAVAMPSTTTIHLIGSPDKGRASDHLVHGVAPVPLSSRATEDASPEWLQTGIAPSLVGTNGHQRHSHLAHGLQRDWHSICPKHAKRHKRR
jgi:hypothetical protein